MPDFLGADGGLMLGWSWHSPRGGEDAEGSSSSWPLRGSRNTIEVQVRQALSVADGVAAAVRSAKPLVADDLTPNAVAVLSRKGTVASYAPSIPPVAADFSGLLATNYKNSCILSNPATKIAATVFGNSSCLGAS